MPDTTNTKSDLEILTQLNADFVASAQNGDVRRFEQTLAEDFMASLPESDTGNPSRPLAPRLRVGDGIPVFSLPNTSGVSVSSTVCSSRVL